MARQTATVSRDMAVILLQYAANIGLDLQRLRKHSGFKTDEGTYANGRIPIARIFPLWVEVVRRSGDPNFGMHLGEASHTMTNGGILLSVMLNCADVGSALEILIRYHDLATDFVQFSLHQAGEFARLTWETTGAAAHPERQYSEMVFCQLVFMLRRLSQNTVQPVEIRFCHPRPEDITEQQRVFACPLVFDCPKNELVLRREDLARPIFLANPALLNKLEQVAGEMLEQTYPPDSWAEKVTCLIDHDLWRGERPSLPGIAAEFALSPRQLQNKLSQEGVTYQILLDDVRKENALRRLKDPCTSICDIAFLLGFSQQSTFNHAFKRWTGKSPGEYR